MKTTIDFDLSNTWEPSALADRIADIVYGRFARVFLREDGSYQIGSANDVWLHPREAHEESNRAWRLSFRYGYTPETAAYLAQALRMTNAELL